MIELRWLEEAGERRLQWREMRYVQTMAGNVLPMPTEWTDVPVVIGVPVSHDT